MSVLTVVSRYAKSLLDLAIEKQILEEVKGDIEHFIQYAANREFLLFLRSPIIHTEKKRNIFNRLFKDKLSKMTLHFLEIILRKGRENILPEIADDFIRQYNIYKQITTVRLTSAATVSDTVVNEIKKKLKSFKSVRANIDLQVETDSHLIGGFVLEFDDKLYDSSLLYKLKQLERQYSEQSFNSNS
jgi:F-type H+-transporting ATPase subunit delta